MIQEAVKNKAPQDYEDGYIIAGDGIYEKRSSGWISHMTKIESIPDLPEIGECTFLKIKLPKIPFGLILDSWDFFREVSKKFKGEAIVLLTYDEKSFGLIAPKQEVSGSSLKYDTDGCVNVIGTIHSHNTMSAFHSGVDDADEQKMDGIHITLGNVLESFPSISCSATKNGERFMCRVDSLFDFKETDRVLDIPKSLENVKDRIYAKPLPLVDPMYNSHQSRFGWYDKDRANAGVYDDGVNFQEWYRDKLKH